MSSFVTNRLELHQKLFQHGYTLSCKSLHKQPGNMGGPGRSLELLLSLVGAQPLTPPLPWQGAGRGTVDLPLEDMSPSFHPPLLFP